MRVRGALAAAVFTAAVVWPGPAYARAQAADDTPRTAGSEVPAPKRTHFVPPEYPPDAQARGLRGIVILELLIDTKGKVASVTVTRSVPPFDDAALVAARQWEYEVTKVGGKAVPVRLSVPITFTMPVPRVTRQEGIPEVVQGANPGFPPGQQGPASVVAEVTLEPSGQVSEIIVDSGDSVFADALLDALRTWRFAPRTESGTVSFRAEADFVPGGKGEAPKVEVRLTGLRRSETTAASPAPSEPGTTASPEPVAEASPAPAPGASPAAPATAASPEPAPLAAGAASTPAPPAAAPPAAAPPKPVMIPPPPGPPTEVLGPAPMPSPELPPTAGGTNPAAPGPAAAPPQQEAPVSAVRDVALAPGVPDLMRGRRPVVPPLARMASVTGAVEVGFAVDASGAASVQDVTGPELLKEAARQTVASWLFRRTTADRLHLAATFIYAAGTANATVRREE